MTRKAAATPETILKNVLSRLNVMDERMDTHRSTIATSTQHIAKLTQDIDRLDVRINNLLHCITQTNARLDEVSENHALSVADTNKAFAALHQRLDKAITQINDKFQALDRRDCQGDDPKEIMRVAAKRLLIGLDEGHPDWYDGMAADAIEEIADANEQLARERFLSI